MGDKKYIFVTGGVCSSLGKGIAASSIGVLLQAAGYQINMMKIDPYLNIDAGTMRPYEHGEVYVTDDGTETDLDLGNYERFAQIKATAYSSLTTGQVYKKVIEAEREGEYLGETVQVIPHITNEIKRRIRILDEANESHIIIIELGGTVGDIEGIPFIEAVRQFQLEEGRENVKFVHLTLVPRVTKNGELKTKPSQHSVKALMSMGIQPDFLFCRSDVMLTDSVKGKLALFCNMEEQCIFSAIDVDTIYEVPLKFHEQNADKIILDKLNLPYMKPKLRKWQTIVKIAKNPEHIVKIAFVGKYTQLEDAYKSVDEALRHAGIANNAKVQIERIDSEDIEKGEVFLPEDADALLIPGGFGIRGVKGKMKAIKHARTNNLPFFGICLGLQCAIIEYSRNVCNISEANSREFDIETTEPVIELLSNLKGITTMGGTMRLGRSKSLLEKGTYTQKIYKKTEIYERHRHRYEINPEYVDKLTSAGMIVSGLAENGLVETIELSNHPWFIAVQYHPEFMSWPIDAHPLFTSFIAAALEHKQARVGTTINEQNIDDSTDTET